MNRSIKYIKWFIISVIPRWTLLFSVTTNLLFGCNNNIKVCGGEREEPLLPRKHNTTNPFSSIYFSKSVLTQKKKITLQFFFGANKKTWREKNKVTNLLYLLSGWGSVNDKCLFLFRLCYLFLSQISTLTGHRRPPLVTSAAKTETGFLLLFFSFRNHPRRFQMVSKEMWLTRSRRKLWWVLVYTLTLN